MPSARGKASVSEAVLNVIENVHTHRREKALPGTNAGATAPGRSQVWTRSRSLRLQALGGARRRVIYAGGRPITVTWLTITDLGRQTLADT
jgi:hypothetical protein